MIGPVNLSPCSWTQIDGGALTFISPLAYCGPLPILSYACFNALDALSITFWMAPEDIENPRTDWQNVLTERQLPENIQRKVIPYLVFVKAQKCKFSEQTRQ